MWCGATFVIPKRKRQMKNLFATAAALALLRTSALAATGPPPFVTGTPTPVIITNPDTAPAPVTVTNPPTPSAPDFTINTNDPGRIPYQSLVVFDPISGCVVGSSNCVIKFGDVPVGSRLVVQHVSGSISFNGSPTTAGVFVDDGTDIFKGAVFFSIPAVGVSRFDQPVLLFIDGGGHPQVAANVQGGTFTVSGGLINLSGYLLDCTVNRCAPIAR
jgi:hypothetical protein